MLNKNFILFSNDTEHVPEVTVELETKWVWQVMKRWEDLWSDCVTLKAMFHPKSLHKKKKNCEFYGITGQPKFTPPPHPLDNSTFKLAVVIGFSSNTQLDSHKYFSPPLSGLA